VASWTEQSHGRHRVRSAIRRDRPPKNPTAVAAAPVNDPVTGRFVPENPGGRLRQLAAIAKATSESLLRLPVDSVASWLRPHLKAAQDHAQRLCDALPAPTEELIGLVGDLARARLMATAAVTEGAREECDPATAAEWRSEARAWMKEARALTLTLRAIAKDTASDDNNEQADLRRRQAEFQHQLAQRQLTEGQP
jgi:hypothetical protein